MEKFYPEAKWFSVENPKELTLDNAKEFFFDFSCIYEGMDGGMKKFWELNIPQERIIEWTMEYYEKDILKYEEKDLIEKMFYLAKLTGAKDQFTKPFFLKLCKMFYELLEDEKLYEVFHNKFRIVDAMFFYYKPVDKFLGIIPKLRELNEELLLYKYVEKLVEIVKRFDEFEIEGFRGRIHYYNSLMLFNETYNLNLKKSIKKLKK